MDRVLKFRMWDFERHAMFLVSKLDNTGSYNRIWEAQADGEKGLTPNCVLMQYTGMRDKTGVEIYEGDILCSEKNCMWDEGRCNTAVEFVDGCFVSSSSGVALSTIVKSFKPVVIGNIYEDSHLLKEGE